MNDEVQIVLRPRRSANLGDIADRSWERWAKKSWYSYSSSTIVYFMALLFQCKIKYLTVLTELLYLIRLSQAEA